MARRITFISGRTGWVLATLFLQAGCSPEASWQQKEHAALRVRIAQLQKNGDERARLIVRVVGRLDAGTLLVGGSFCDGGGAIRSCLLRSGDNGKTWRDSGVFMDGCDVVDLVILDSQRARIVVGWSIEGDLPPYYTFRTEDGGRTWRRSSTPIPGGPIPGGDALGIPTGYGVTYRDAREGAFVYIDSAYRRLTFRTDSGGDVWRLVKTEPLPQDRAEAEGQTLRRQPSSVRAEDDLKTETITIAETADGGKTWRPLGRLPWHYRLGTNDVEFSK